MRLGKSIANCKKVLQEVRSERPGGQIGLDPSDTVRRHLRQGVYDEFRVVKVDAEGHEPAVFGGMSEYLGCVREIVFEEYAYYPAPSHQVLQRAGYTVFAMEERLRGPQDRRQTARGSSGLTTSCQVM